MAHPGNRTQTMGRSRGGEVNEILYRWIQERGNIAVNYRQGIFGIGTSREGNLGHGRIQRREVNGGPV